MTGLVDPSARVSEETTVGYDEDVVLHAANDGKVFEGLKVVVRGSAFNQGLLGAPKSVDADASLAEEKTPRRATGTFVSTGAGEWTATLPNLKCERTIELDVKVPATAAGKADFEVSHMPVTEKIKPLTFQVAVKVDAPEPASTAAQPAETTTSEASASPTDQTPPQDTTPKTNFEMGQQQGSTDSQ